MDLLLTSYLRNKKNILGNDMLFTGSIEFLSFTNNMGLVGINWFLYSGLRYMFLLNIFAYLFELGTTQEQISNFIPLYLLLSGFRDEKSG